ncbi:MAG: HD domain-containing phosphohydrolase [Spirochaetales bacterium]
MQATEEYSSLILELSQTALAASSVPEAVTPILRSLVDETSAVGAAYWQDSGDLLRNRACYGQMPASEEFELLMADGLPTNLPLLESLRTQGSPVLIEDTGEDSRCHQFHGFGIASLAAAPVINRGGEFVGAFLMHTFGRHTWSPAERGLFASVAGVLSSLAARLVAEEKAVNAREGAIRALGLALEYRDRETKGHTDRVTALAGSIAREMQLDEDTRLSLRWGAYLHDIGKISIPDSILLKPGSLDASEWETLKTHPTAGYEFARALGFLPAVSLDVILYHHEKWNGAGYPARLRGTEIPLSGRIFAVADVFDALVSARPYKPAWSLSDARDEIAAQSGEHFDPDVVAAFLDSQGYAPQRNPARASRAR